MSHGCRRDVFEYNVGYILWSLISRVERCFAAVVYSIDDYTLRTIESLLSPQAHAVIFYAKHNGTHKPTRITLARIDNHYKHYLFDNWGAAKGTNNLNYYELELRSPEELEVETIDPKAPANTCRLLREVASKLQWALKARPQASAQLEQTPCNHIIRKTVY